MNESVETVVIVGASLAGLRASQAVRASGFAGRLTLVGDEPHPPYQRPPLSKAVLAGDAHPDEATLAAELDVFISRVEQQLDGEGRFSPTDANSVASLAMLDELAELEAASRSMRC